MAARFAAVESTDAQPTPTTAASDPWAGLEAPAPTVATKAEPLAEKPVDVQGATDQPKAEDDKKPEGGPAAG